MSEDEEGGSDLYGRAPDGDETKGVVFDLGANEVAEFSVSGPINAQDSPGLQEGYEEETVAAATMPHVPTLAVICSGDL